MPLSSRIWEKKNKWKTFPKYFMYFEKKMNNKKNIHAFDTPKYFKKDLFILAPTLDKYVNMTNHILQYICQ